jgi:hypothetical protein
LPQALPCVHLGGVIDSNGRDGGDNSEWRDEHFACTLHGRCTLVETDQCRPSQDRGCDTCSDYVARDPFGPNSAQMLREAEFFLAAVPAYPQRQYRGRGVVIAGGGERFFPSLYVTVRALRHVGCRLPIQIWYLGRNHEMPAKRKALLAPFHVECVDADKVRRRHPARHLDGWQLKVFATLHSPFEEVLFLDADCYPCRNPEFLFELEDYRARGAIFWPDTEGIDYRLVWSAFGVRDPRRLGSVESGQFVLHKRLCWRPLNLAWFYNDRSDYYYNYGYGDKHTFEVAWERCAQPFVMWERKAKWVGAAYLHSGPDRLPLFVHRCSDKFRFKRHTYTTSQYHSLPVFYSALPLEHECWSWMGELARLTGHRFVDKTAPVLRRSRKSSAARFAIATLFTPDMADLGLRTSRVMSAYAKRHGYQMIVAKARIDTSRPAAWSKLLLIERYFAENPDCAWLMWMDADAVITNPMQRLEDLVDDNVDFLVAEDPPRSPINTGVFLVRNCPAAFDMFRRAYAKVQYIHHPWWEQLAIADAMRDCADTLRTRSVSRRLFNSFANEYQKGDFIVHFAGETPEAKLAGVRKVTASAIGPDRRSAFNVSVPDLVNGLLPKNPQPIAQVRKGLASDLPVMFCITCWQTPLRSALALEHFRERRLSVNFFPGIHGATFGLRTTLHARPRYQMPAGHVGALLSHYMLWQTLAYLPHEEIMILEDDAWFEPDFRSRFRRAYADLPEDWQFVFVGATVMLGKPFERITDRVGVMRYPCGLHAYLVKRSALPFLLHTNHEARNHVDYQLIENSLPAMKCYTFTPSLVKQRSAWAADGTGENWPSTTRRPGR